LHHKTCGFVTGVPTPSVECISMVTGAASADCERWEPDDGFIPRWRVLLTQPLLP